MHRGRSPPGWRGMPGDDLLRSRRASPPRARSRDRGRSGDRAGPLGPLDRALLSARDAARVMAWAGDRSGRDAASFASARASSPHRRDISNRIMAPLSADGRPSAAGHALALRRAMSLSHPPTHRRGAPMGRRSRSRSPPTYSTRAPYATDSRPPSQPGRGRQTPNHFIMASDLHSEVKMAIEDAFAKGKFTSGDILQSNVSQLMAMPVDIALEAVAEFANINKGRVNHPAAFFTGVMKRIMDGRPVGKSARLSTMDGDMLDHHPSRQERERPRERSPLRTSAHESYGREQASRAYASGSGRDDDPKYGLALPPPPPLANGRSTAMDSSPPSRYPPPPPTSELDNGRAVISDRERLERRQSAPEPMARETAAPREPLVPRFDPYTGLPLNPEDRYSQALLAARNGATARPSTAAAPPIKLEQADDRTYAREPPPASFPEPMRRAVPTTTYDRHADEDVGRTRPSSGFGWGPDAGAPRASDRDRDARPSALPPPFDDRWGPRREPEPMGRPREMYREYSPPRRGSPPRGYYPLDMPPRRGSPPPGFRGPISMFMDRGPYGGSPGRGPMLPMMRGPPPSLRRSPPPRSPRREARLRGGTRSRGTGVSNGRPAIKSVAVAAPEGATQEENGRKRSRADSADSPVAPAHQDEGNGDLSRREEGAMSEDGGADAEQGDDNVVQEILDDEDNINETWQGNDDDGDASAFDMANLVDKKQVQQALAT